MHGSIKFDLTDLYDAHFSLSIHIDIIKNQKVCMMHQIGVTYLSVN